MLIGIDANEANIKKRVGVNVYAFELLCSIYDLIKNGQKKKDPIKFTLYLKDRPLKDMPKETSWWQYKVIPGKFFWIITKLTPHLFFGKDKLDVFFSPSHYLPPFLKVPSVFSIMDLGYLEFSGQFRKKDFWQLKYWTARSVFISKYIITISNASKKDIVRHYPRASQKVFVTYPSFNEKVYSKPVSPKDVRRIKDKYAIVDDYILFLGTLKPSKNVGRLVEAYSKVKEEVNGVKLVIAGKKGWLYDSIFEKVESLGLEKDVIFTDFVPEKDKPALISGARALVIPSLWEGFGLDPLYAMALGIPVVSSVAGSLPEVVGKAGVMFDPESVSDISKKILMVLKANNAEYNKIVVAGKKQVGKFSWEKTARKTLEILIKAKKDV